MPIDPIKLDDPRIQRGLEAIAKRMESKPKWPYYNEESGLKVKNWLEELHRSSVPIRISGLGATLRLKYYQGARYLFEKLDKSFEEVYRRTKCTTSRRFIELTIRDIPLRQDAIPKGAFNKEELLTFIENSELGSKFYLETILAQDEVDWINSRLADLVLPPRHPGEDPRPMFIASVTNNEIRIIRIE